MRECKACGSPLEGAPLARSWTCAYCKTVNFNEAFLQQHIATIDFAKTHNLLQVGLTAYQAGDYRKALDVLERVLMEDSSNVDAWVYTALATSFLADMSNYESSAQKVESYIGKAGNINPDSEIISTGRSVCANTLGRVALRMVERQYDHAQKTWFSYESVDPGKATRKTNEELNAGLRCAGHAFSLNPDDLKIAGRIALITVQSDRLYKGNNPHKAIVAKANAVLETVKQKNPALYSEYSSILSPPKQKSGCAGQACAILAVLATSGVMFVVALMIFAGL